MKSMLVTRRKTHFHNQKDKACFHLHYNLLVKLKRKPTTHPSTHAPAGSNIHFWVPKGNPYVQIWGTQQRLCCLNPTCPGMLLKLWGLSWAPCNTRFQNCPTELPLLTVCAPAKSHVLPEEPLALPAHALWDHDTQGVAIPQEWEVTASPSSHPLLS